MSHKYIDRYDLFEELTNKFGSEVGIQESEICKCIYCHLQTKNVERIKEFHSYLKKNWASNYLFTFVGFLKMKVTVLSVCPNSQVRCLFEAIEDSHGSVADKEDRSLIHVTFVKC